MPWTSHRYRSAWLSASQIPLTSRRRLLPKSGGLCFSLVSLYWAFRRKVAHTKLRIPPLMLLMLLAFNVIPGIWVEHTCRDLSLVRGNVCTPSFISRAEHPGWPQIPEHLLHRIIYIYLHQLCPLISTRNSENARRRYISLFDPKKYLYVVDVPINLTIK